MYSCARSPFFVYFTIALKWIQNVFGNRCQICTCRPMLASDCRFVVWCQCDCGSSFTVFRGHRDVIAVPQCTLKGFGAVCDIVLFDRRYGNRVCAFLFKDGSRIPPRLEAIGGWSCPVLKLSSEDIACVGPHPQSRFKSILRRPCSRCMSRNLYIRKTRLARAAFLNWKSNCPFLYN